MFPASRMPALHGEQQHELALLLLVPCDSAERLGEGASHHAKGGTRDIDELVTPAHGKQQCWSKGHGRIGTSTSLARPTDAQRILDLRSPREKLPESRRRSKP
jgi:hypothetical protein